MLGRCESTRLRRSDLAIALLVFLLLHLDACAALSADNTAADVRIGTGASCLVADALVASGVTELQPIEDYLNSFAKICERLDDSLGATIRSPQDRAAAVHRFLHREVLFGEYDASCSQVDITLDEGTYNCVSATVLFHALCQHVDLRPVAVARRTHVFSRLPESGIDVETTCAEWFDRDGRDESIGHQDVDDREIDDRQLVAKVYFNRGVALLEQRAFPQAIELIRASLAWDAADSSARENLLAGLNNWALAESDAGQFELAARLIDEGLAMDRNYEPLLANDIHVRQRWTVALCERQRFGEARDVLQAGFERRSDVALFDAGRLAVYRLWALALIRGGRVEEGLAVFQDARKRVGPRTDVAACEAATLAESLQELQRMGRIETARRLRGRLDELSRAS